MGDEVPEILLTLHLQSLSLVFDMETSDPDDALTLALISTHPSVDLRAVTVFPGGPDQVGVVKEVLRRVGKESVPVGAGSPRKVAHRVSSFHYDWLGKVEPREADAPAAEILLAALRGGATDLLTGAPLTNIYSALQASRTAFFREWTCQGGFAGDDVVPPEHRLEKFSGRITCPTFNLNGDVEAARALISSPRIDLKRFVTKNVCHGVIYDEAFHARIPSGAHAGLDLFREGMSAYFRKHPGGKALHDIIAAVLAICPSAAQWALGKIYRHKGEWGTKLWDDFLYSTAPGPDFITVALDRGLFERVLSLAPQDVNLSVPTRR